MYSGTGQLNITGASTHKPVAIAGKSDFSTLKPHVWKKAYRSALRTVNVSQTYIFWGFCISFTPLPPLRSQTAVLCYHRNWQIFPWGGGGVRARDCCQERNQGTSSPPFNLQIWTVVVSVNISLIEQNSKKDQSVAHLQNRTIHRKKPISLELS